MRIYAMSDIHGCLEPFRAALSAVDLDDPESKLVLLGDYCDRVPIHLASSSWQCGSRSAMGTALWP